MKGFGLFGVSIRAGEYQAAEQLRDEAREQLLVEIRSAREQGASWGEIAQAMGAPNKGTPRMMIARADR